MILGARARRDFGRILSVSVCVSLTFASLPDCTQNQIAVSDTLRSFMPRYLTSNTTRVVQQH